MSGSAPFQPRRLAAVMSIDIAASSRMVERDEDSALAAFRRLFADVVEPAIARHRGRVFKRLGDGLLAEFTSAVDSVRAALAIQVAAAQEGVRDRTGAPVRLRLGINLGDVVVDGDDLLGDGVNVAVRLQELAPPGGIYVARALREQIADRLALRWRDVGTQPVKNIERSIAIDEILVEAAGPADPVAGDRVRVFIATTDGPAEIVGLVAEDPALRSVVCLNGTSTILPISPGYDAFVRAPSGVIERRFGERVFRLDVSRPISTGNSWQLGALAAHALLAAGRLARRDEPAGRAWWLTGEVDRDLRVIPVDHVAQKLATSRELFADLASRGIELEVFLPAGTDPAAIPEVTPAATRLERADELLRKAAGPAFAAASVAASGGAGIDRNDVPARKPRGRFAAAAAMLLIAIGTLAYATAAVRGEMQAWRSLVAAGDLRGLAAKLEAAEAGACITCRAADFVRGLDAGPAASRDRVPLVARERPRGRFESCADAPADDAGFRAVARESAERFAPVRRDAACAVEYAIRNAGDTPVSTWIALARIPAGGDSPLEWLGHQGRVLEPAGRQAVTLPLAGWSGASGEHVVAAVRMPVSEESGAWLKDEIGRRWRQGGAPALAEFARRLDRLGAGAELVVHALRDGP